MKKVLLRITEDKDYDKIVEMSKKNKRSINGEIQIAIEKHIQNETI